MEDDPVSMVDTEELEHVRYSSDKKSTTFMKLKNRIKTLELNLNLSSRYKINIFTRWRADGVLQTFILLVLLHRYLEELSQRYKRQMEEMYVSLNRTIMKLANTSKSAEARVSSSRFYWVSQQEGVIKSES